MELRPARLSDDFLLSWRNDPETRAHSLNTAEITVAEHRAWLERSLKDQSRSIQIAEIDGVPVGMVRVDWRDDEHTECEISYTVAPEFRGSGVGSGLVCLTISTPELANATVTAKVKRGNRVSQRILAKAGLELASGDGDILTYRRGPPPESILETPEAGRF